jgi:hypothetical protein
MRFSLLPDFWILLSFFSQSKGKPCIGMPVIATDATSYRSESETRSHSSGLFCAVVNQDDFAQMA